MTTRTIADNLLTEATALTNGLQACAGKHPGLTEVHIALGQAVQLETQIRALRVTLEQEDAARHGHEEGKRRRGKK